MKVQTLAVLAIVGIGVGFILIELLARQLPPPYERDNGDSWQCNRATGWLGRPNQTESINTEGYKHTVTWNSRGMHDVDHSIEKEVGVFRILILGDSFVEARQVADGDTMRSVLENTLNAADNGVEYEVLIGAASAWGPGQELMYFRSEGAEYSPDLVLSLWVPANDLRDNLPEHRMTYSGVNCYSPYFPICDTGFDDQAWYETPGIKPAWKGQCPSIRKIQSNALNWLYNSSSLYQHLEPLMTRSYSHIDYASDFSPWLPNDQSGTIDIAYGITEGIYSALARESKGIGAEMAVVIVPVKEAVLSDASAEFRERLEERKSVLAEADSRLPNRRLKEVLSHTGLPVLDLQPTFVKHQMSGAGMPYYELDSHWSVAGNRLAGETIAQWLTDERLVVADGSE